MIRTDFDKVIKTDLDYAVKVFKNAYPLLFVPRRKDKFFWQVKERFKENFFPYQSQAIDLGLNLNKTDSYGYLKHLLLNEKAFFRLLDNEDIKVEFYIMKKLGYSHKKILNFLIKYSFLEKSEKKKLARIWAYGIRKIILNYLQCQEKES